MLARVKLGAQALAVVTVAALLGLLVWNLAHDDVSDLPSRVAAGEKPSAPGFSLPRLGAEGAVSLTTLRGKPFVLNFWASWCDPCAAEAPALEQAWRRYKERGLVVVGVNVNDFTSDAKGFVRKHRLTYPIVRDSSASTLGEYGLTGLPETFYVDRRGRVVAHSRGKVEEADLVAAIARTLKSS